MNEEQIFGLFDIEDAIWLGDEVGPFRYTQKEAEFAREVVCERMGWPLERVEIRPYQSARKKRDTLIYRETLETALDNISLRKMSEGTGIPINRLRRIEGGRTIQTKEEDNKIREYLTKERGEE